MATAATTTALAEHPAVAKRTFKRAVLSRAFAKRALEPRSTRTTTGTATRRMRTQRLHPQRKQHREPYQQSEKSPWTVHVLKLTLELHYTLALFQSTPSTGASSGDHNPSGKERREGRPRDPELKLRHRGWSSGRSHSPSSNTTLNIWTSIQLIPKKSTRATGACCVIWPVWPVVSCLGSPTSPAL